MLFSNYLINDTEESEKLKKKIKDLEKQLKTLKQENAGVFNTNKQLKGMLAIKQVNFPL